LGREDEADAVEVVFQVDRFFEVGERELCVDLACYCELGTDVKDSIMINASQWMLVAHTSERSQGQYLPGEREAWNSDFEKRDATRADLPGDIRRDAQIRVDGTIQAYIKVDRRVSGFTTGMAIPYVPKYNTSSEMLGGANVPAAIAPRATDTLTSAPTSREMVPLADN
jgi:hypothetical protein